MNKKVQAIQREHQKIDSIKKATQRRSEMTNYKVELLEAEARKKEERLVTFSEN